MTDDELHNEILWWEALRDSIEDGEIEAALEAIDAAIKLRRKALGGKSET